MSLSTLRKMFGNMTGLGMSPDGKRNYYDVYGYPQQINFHLYYWLHKRADIAKRITQGVARSCWRQGASLEIDGKEVLQDEIKKLKRLGLFNKLMRADTLNRIGKFSVLYVGVPDNLDPSEPLGLSNSNSINNLYFQPYAYDGVTIRKWDNDPTSPRCGLPELYQLQIIGRGDKEKDVSTKNMLVHHSRVVHMAEGALDSDIEGCSALESVYNRFVDLNKSVGGSSEAFFRNADGKYSLETNPEYAMNLDAQAKQELDDQTEAFINNMQGFMRLNGIKANRLDVSHNSPRDTFDVAIELISGETGIPIRILTGKGSGQLAGSEDKASYNTLIAERREDVCEQWLYDVFKILHDSRIINLPNNCDIKWPLTEAASEKEKSEVRKNNATAFKTVADALNPINGMEVNDPEKVISDIIDMDIDLAKFFDDDDDGGDLVDY